MRHARRLIAILVGCATWCLAASSVAYAKVVANDPAVVARDPHEMPGFYNNYQHVAPAASSTSSAGTPFWQYLAYGALGVLLIVAIVGLGYSLSHSRKSEPSPRSQTPLRS